MAKGNKSDPLEFNDGVGDMLRFGKRRKRKWWRLPLLIIVGLFILSISFVLSYELGKILFLPKTDTKTFVPDSVKEPQFDQLEEEFAYKEKKTTTKEPTKNVKSQETITKNAEKQKTKEIIKNKEEKIPTKSVQKAKPKTKETNTTKNVINNTKETTYKVIIGGYSKKEKALEEARSLLDKGFSAYVWQSGSLWKIQIGSFKSKENAEALKKKAADAGHPAAITND